MSANPKIVVVTDGEPDLSKGAVKARKLWQAVRDYIEDLPEHELGHKKFASVASTIAYQKLQAAHRRHTALTVILGGKV